ncbi:MAG: FtsX-like permease family protein [Acutalibacteraceae bacterium]|nr:FtsX-like permease family protein [Acutalibacteraceae bacterium]
MTKSYVTDSLRSIKRSFSRFVSIIAIVAMGSGLFCGLNAVGPDMKETANEYYYKYNLMDLRLQSYIGLYEEDLEQIRNIEGVKAVQGAKFVDGYVQTFSEENEEYEGIVDIDGSELTVRVMGVDLDKAIEFYDGIDNPDYINRLKLVEGRYPEADNECVITCSGLTTPEQFKMGETIKVVGDGEEITYSLKYNTFNVVGIVQTPYWVSYERGVTTAGSGKLGDFVYVTNSAFTDKINYYSEAYVTLEGADEFEAYTEEYDEFVAGMRQKIAEESEPIAAVRRAQLKVGLKQKLNSAKSQIEQAEATIGTKLKEGKEQLDYLYELERDGEKMLEEAQKTLDEEYKKAQSQLDSGNTQYMAAVNEYNEKYTTVANKKVELANKKSEYNSKRMEADNAKGQLAEAKTKLSLAEAEIKITEGLITSTQSTLETLEANQNVSQEDLHLDQIAERLEETNPELAKILLSASNLTAQGMAADAIVEVEQLLDQYQTELAVAKQQKDAGQKEYDSKKAEYDAAEVQLNSAKKQLDDAEVQLADAERKLEEFKNQIEASGDKLQYGSIEAQTKYMAAQAELALRTTQYQNIQATIEKAEKTYNEASEEINKQIGSVKTEYEKGQNLLQNIEDSVGWSVYTRHDSPGYTGYGQAADNMVRLAYIFPTFFFIVSTLVCLTTMTRMVEEERTQLGTLKALGYSNKMISGKYLLYSALASFIGVILGTAIGSIGVPLAVCGAWGIMYEMPETIIQFLPVYIILGVIIAIGSTVLAAYLACRKELATVPAVLMRPKPPKAGKRVFLENISSIWSKLSFTSKVTVRNLFRNKKRFAVTVIGIAGCTALILSAFGIRGALGGVVDNQYSKENGVARYDLQVVLKDGQIDYDNSSVVREINAKEGIEKSMLGYLKVCTGFSDRSDKSMEIDILIPQNPADFQNFIDLKLGNNDIPLSDEGAVITTKLADKTNTKIGDKLKVSWVEGSKTYEYEVLVTGIVDNYTFHYVYMTPYYFSNLIGTPITYNYLFCKVDETFTTEQKAFLEKSINESKDVNGSVFTTVVIDNVNNIVETLNLVVVVLIIAAMGLAIVVLYNLNNINVNERIRELATLKVLGFYNGEVSAYIYRENIFLTIIGILIGLVLGIPLNVAVIGAVDVDQLTFNTTLAPISYVIAAIITITIAVLVNVGMHFKLKKISMVESLKSVE